MQQQFEEKSPLARVGKNYGGDKSDLFKPWVSRGRRSNFRLPGTENRPGYCIYVYVFIEMNV
jgi:hypothetical protein